MEVKIKRLTSVLFLLTLLFLTTCVSTNDNAADSITFKTPSHVKADWHKLNSYADTFDFYIQEPLALCHGIKIDLQNPSLVIEPFPYLTSFPDPQISASKLSETCDILINTTPYFSKSPLSSKKAAGITQSHKIRYSNPLSRYAALALYKTAGGYEAKIFKSQSDIPEYSEAEAENLTALHGGFWQILENGNIIEFQDIKDSRTACGISKDGRFLYILAVEGEVKAWSEGLNYQQCAEIFKAFGCQNAMEFDGGSSTTLYINQKNALSYYKNPSLPAFLCFK